MPVTIAKWGEKMKANPDGLDVWRFLEKLKSGDFDEFTPLNADDDLDIPGWDRLVEEERFIKGG